MMKKKVDKKVIALVGGSFKPPHFGHFDMVRKYTDLADEVKVIISNPKSPKSIRKTKTGIVITPEMSKRIWEIFINRYGLKNKVSVEISEKPSPIIAVYEYVDNEIKDAVILLGTSKKDDNWKRFSNASEYFKDRDDLTIVDPKEGAVDPLEMKNGIPFSATQVRDNIDDKDVVKKMMPDKLTDFDINEIVEILSIKNESLDGYSDDFLKQYIDIDKSTISYLGNMRHTIAYFGPFDSLCKINMVTKDGKEKIHVEYKQKKWLVEYNGKPVKESSKGYKALIESGEFKKLEAKLFNRWNEMKKYPRRMLKNAKLSFGSKYSDDELKTMCKERLAFLKENF